MSATGATGAAARRRWQVRRRTTVTLTAREVRDIAYALHAMGKWVSTHMERMVRDRLTREERLSGEWTCYRDAAETFEPAAAIVRGWGAVIDPIPAALLEWEPDMLCEGCEASIGEDSPDGLCEECAADAIAAENAAAVAAARGD